jgi:hypothetical protein
MECQVKDEARGKYWILFLQPLPEAGERIAIALVFCDIGGRPRVEFDRRLSKALKMYPGLDSDGLVFYLDSLQRELHSSRDIDLTLSSYGPQISTSSPRRIASPISDKIIQMLLAKYVRPAKPALKVPNYASAPGFIERIPQSSALSSLGTAPGSLEIGQHAPQIIEQKRPLQCLVEQTQSSLLGLTA